MIIDSNQDGMKSDEVYIYSIGVATGKGEGAASLKKFAET